MAGVQSLLPEGWARPSGYSNGVAASGRTVFVAGQIGWDQTGRIVSNDFAEQFRQVLINTLAVLSEAGAGPADVCRMTWYVTSREDYVTALPALGVHWKALMGRSYPAMAVLIVAGLVEPGAKIEIETTAMVDP